MADKFSADRQARMRAGQRSTRVRERAVVRRSSQCTLAPGGRVRARDLVLGGRLFIFSDASARYNAYRQRGSQCLRVDDSQCRTESSAIYLQLNLQPSS